MSVNLDELFRLDVSALQLIVRTSVVYLAILVAMRIVGRREIGSVELPDLLMIVLIADGVQNGMAGDYKSVTGALIVAATLIGWNYALDWLVYHVPVIARLLRPAPLLVVQDGRINRRNLRRELMTVDELRQELRVQGIEDVSSVKQACLEPDGQLSVIKREGNDDQSRREKRKSGPA